MDEAIDPQNQNPIESLIIPDSTVLLQRSQ
jgi:hypothetical protein